MKKRFGEFTIKKFEKPPSLKDCLSSDSSGSSGSDEEDSRFEGLSSAARNIGEGAALYL